MVFSVSVSIILLINLNSNVFVFLCLLIGNVVQHEFIGFVLYKCIYFTLYIFRYINTKKKIEILINAICLVLGYFEYKLFVVYI